MTSIHSLQGMWSQPNAVFMWEAAKIFHKLSSDNFHDYWVSYASGACLSSSSQCMSARFDPVTNFLTFNPRGTTTVDGPWKLLQSPISLALKEETVEIDGRIDTKHTSNLEYQYVFFTKQGLRKVEEKLPHLFSTAWNDTAASQELMHIAKTNGRLFGEMGGVLEFVPERQENAIRDDTLPHGAKWAVSYLQSIDRNERSIYQVLMNETSGRDLPY